MGEKSLASDTVTITCSLVLCLDELGARTLIQNSGLLICKMRRMFPFSSNILGLSGLQWDWQKPFPRLWVIACQFSHSPLLFLKPRKWTRARRLSVMPLSPARATWFSAEVWETKVLLIQAGRNSCSKDCTGLQWLACRVWIPAFCSVSKTKIIK